MRTPAGLLLIAMVTGAAPVASAQAASPPDSESPLFRVVFTQDGQDPRPTAFTPARTPPNTADDDQPRPPQGALVGADLVQDRVMQGLSGLGMHTVNSAALAERGRWYVFAAASGREVGLNVAGEAWNSLHRLGWSAEGASTLVSDAEAGVAWRKGHTQASVGYVHRQIDGELDGPARLSRLSDSMVAFSLSIQPR